MSRTVTEEGPRQGQIGVQPTPQQTGISETLQSETGKLTPEIADKLASVVSRKNSALRLVLFALIAAAACVGLHAQVPPYVHGATVGTTPIQALPQDRLRRKLFLFNSTQAPSSRSVRPDRTATPACPSSALCMARDRSP